MKTYKIGIYSREGCTYCDLAKSLLEDHGLKYTEQTVETPDEKVQLKTLYPEARTLPVIIIDGEWIGGYTNLVDWIRKHKDENI